MSWHGSLTIKEIKSKQKCGKPLKVEKLRGRGELSSLSFDGQRKHQKEELEPSSRAWKCSRTKETLSAFAFTFHFYEKSFQRSARHQITHAISAVTFIVSCMAFVKTVATVAPFMKTKHFSETPCQIHNITGWPDFCAESHKTNVEFLKEETPNDCHHAHW